jgi:hypothetical protein
MFNLDYSIASLDDLEMSLENRNDPNEEEYLKSRAAQYPGEVFRKNVGGRWELCIENPRDLYYKLPLISNYSKMNTSFCPIVLANFFHSRKSLTSDRIGSTHSRRQNLVGQVGSRFKCDSDGNFVLLFTSLFFTHPQYAQSLQASSRHRAELLA